MADGNSSMEDRQQIELTDRQRLLIQKMIVLSGIVTFLTVILSILLSIFVPIRLSGFVWAIPFASFFCAVAAVVALSFPRRLYYLFILAAMALPLYFEELSVGLGFMKLYPADFMFMFSAALLTMDLVIFKQVPFRRIPFNKYVMIFFVVGLIGLFLGLKNGNRFDKVFGDYRRSFFYFSNYFVTLYMVRSLPDLKLMVRMLLIGGILTIPVGIIQVLTGKGYVRSAIDAAHVLSWMQCTFLSFAVFYAVAHLIYLPRVNTKRWITVAALGLIMTVAANFRSNWLGVLLGFSGMFLFLPPAQKLKSLLIAGCGALVLLVGVGAMWDQKIFEERTLGQEISKKANFKDTNIDLNVIWRYQSYAAAYRQIQQHPFTGSGLGTYLTFHIPTSRGTQQLAMDHNVHNSFLWLIMSIGIPGILSLFAMHGCYLLTIWRYLRRSRWNYGRIVVMSCAAYYLSAMTATFFQNYLEQSVCVTVFATVCAVTMLTIYYTPSKYFPDDLEHNRNKF